MSSRSWQQQILQMLSPHGSDARPPRIAVVGIGQELHGDDAAGLAVVRSLRRRLGDRDGLLLMEAGPSPENVTGALRRFGPTAIVLVDAALMGETPGTVCYLDPRTTEGVSASSHTLPLALVADYLTRELASTVCLLGIEPAVTDFEARLSAPVRLGVDRAGRGLGKLLADALACRS